MLDPSSVARHVLANGLTVLVHRDPSAPVAAVVTYVRAGYFDETDDVVGIAHVLEHMFFKGTPTRGVGEIARATKASGGYLNAHTIYDHTSYVAVLPTDGFERGLEIQADAFANSLIDAGELARELQVIIQEARRKLDSPGVVALETLYELLHDRHRIRRWRIGREEELRALRRDQVVGFYRNFYRPGNTIVAIVGDVDVDATLSRVERLYGGIDGGPVQRTPGPREESPPGFRYRELSGDVAQTHLLFGWRSPGSLDADTPALDLFSMILGSGRASRLYAAVREQKLVAGVSADNYTPDDVGVFTVHADGPPSRTGEAAAAIWRVLAGARDDGVTDAEVDRVRRMFESRWLRRLETMEGQASFLVEWEALGSWRLSEPYFSAMTSLGAAQITEAARRHLPAEQAAMLVYRPENETSIAGGAEQAHELIGGGVVLPVFGGGGAPARTTPGARAAVAMQERVEGNVQIFRSAGGVPILVRRRPGSPIAHLGVYIGSGAASEPATLSGLSTIGTRVLVKGTESRSASEIAYQSELLGGSISPSVTSDAMGWTFSVPTIRMAEAIDLLADVVQHPALDDDAIDTERTIALANLAELRDDMYRYPIRLATNAAFDGHPYGRSLLGSEETLQSLTPQDVRDWHRARVLDAPAVIAVVGDVNASEIASQLAGSFDRLLFEAATPVPQVVWPTTVRRNMERRDRAQTALAIAFPAPGRRDAERFAAHLIAAVASGLGGRFFDALREQRSLAYTVHAYAMERRQGGMFLAYIATSPGQEEAAREGLLAQFDRLREEPVTEEELARARTYTLGSHAIALQNGGVALAELVDAWLLGTGLAELETFETDIRSVTVRQMHDLAREYFDPECMAEGIVRGVAAP